MKSMEKEGDEMKMTDLMLKIFEILPNAVFGEEQANGEILIATGLVEDKDGTLVDLDD
jgi:hypothetical protein